MVPVSITFIVLGIFFGYITDKKGKKGNLLIVGFAILAIAHAIFFTFDSCPAS